MEPRPTIKAFVRLQLWEIVRAYLRISLKRFQFGIAVLVAILVFVWIQIFRGYASAGANTGVALSQFQNVLLLALLSLAFPIYLLSASYAVARSCLRYNANLRGGFEYSFSEEGLSYVGEHARGNLAWTGLHRAFETPGVFVLFHDKYTLQAIPKRCFASESDVAAFRELLRKQVPRADLKS
jgi:hypothetical protein